VVLLPGTRYAYEAMSRGVHAELLKGLVPIYHRQPVFVVMGGH